MVSLPDWCPAYNPQKKDAETGEEVFCICKKPDSGELMVGCDGCDDWFHFSCLKMPTKYNELVFSFYCPYCQAGVTGPGATDGNLPKTLWRRKCRVSDCFKPVAENSKYCSEGHAISYLRGLVDRVEVPGHEATPVLREMLREPDFDHFKGVGQNGLPTPSEQLAPGLFSNDAQLQELESQLQKVRGGAKRRVETQLEQLAQYSKWVHAVNELLFGDGNQEHAESTSGSRSKASRAQKRKKAVKKKAICGYSASLVVPCPAEQFVSEFKELEDEPTELRGVCCKLRCTRHLDWAGTQENGLQFQLESLESSEERLQLLVKIREDQLKLQFYKKLTQIDTTSIKIPLKNES
ncbi:LAME_0F12970g1_1 [Lachancea meyersii CBS 8951]|uniref:LAME_0F12970g1_1 n=1 Tax=Lachancea meyersii CBS 8951 TaxID=1266667 RepID=A0A1G4JX80_9SACH|nr:LAME_0F12970g1_1 [Lachancea meyersii CBS 8951]